MFVIVICCVGCVWGWVVRFDLALIGFIDCCWGDRIWFTFWWFFVDSTYANPKLSRLSKQVRKSQRVTICLKRRTPWLHLCDRAIFPKRMKNTTSWPQKNMKNLGATSWKSPTYEKQLNTKSLAKKHLGPFHCLDARTTSTSQVDTTCHGQTSKKVGADPALRPNQCPSLTDLLLLQPSCQCHRNLKPSQTRPKLTSRSSWCKNSKSLRRKSRSGWSCRWESLRRSIYPTASTN